MSGEPPSSIFHAPWFGRSVSEGLAVAGRDGPDQAFEAERTFFSKMILYLLDAQATGRLKDRELFEFYAFCQRHLDRSYSQILQDLWVLFMSREKRGGYFVEFGACDGKLLSNTLLLECDYDWTGILSEPNPIWHAALADNRRCVISHDCVFRSTGETIAFSATNDMPELSRITNIVPNDVHEKQGGRSRADIISVMTIALQDLLDAHGAPREIDYLSIDTEGSEWDILNAFDFGSYTFHLISVEHAGEAKKRNSIKTLLVENGYRLWQPDLTRWDDWYVRT